MPPPATAPDAAAGDGARAPSLDDASARLESALARLEALVDAGPFQSTLFRVDPAASAVEPSFEPRQAELDAVRARGQALEAAAATASQALGRAMAEVRHALDAAAPASVDDAADDPEGEDALDLARATAEDAGP